MNDIIATHKKLGIDYRKKSGDKFVIYLIGNDEGLYKEIAPGKWRFLALPERNNEYMEKECYGLLVNDIVKNWDISKKINNQSILKNEDKKQVYLSLI